MPFGAAEVAEFLPSAWGFVLIGLGAFGLPILARRLALPSVVLEILFGLMIGPELLNIDRITRLHSSLVRSEVMTSHLPRIRSPSTIPITVPVFPTSTASSITFSVQHRSPLQTLAAIDGPPTVDQVDHHVVDQSS